MSARYRLRTRMEGGVLADLYAAVRESDGATVEVKLFHPETTDPAYARALAKDNDALASVSSPGHLRVLDLGVVEGRLTVVREPADGPSLGALVEHLVAEGRPLLFEVGLTLIIQLAQDLAVAHEAGVVHGGLTPGNVAVSPLGRIRVADFGAMRALWAAPLLREALLPGARAAYRAPEAMKSSKGALAPAADLYSLGAIAYELLTLQEPLRRDDGSLAAPSRLKGILPPRLDDHLLRALDPTPGKRFATVSDFGEALRHLLAQQGGAPDPKDVREILAARLPERPQGSGGGPLPLEGAFSLTPLEGVRLAPGRALGAPPRPRRSYSRRPRQLPADERPTEEVTPELLEAALEALYAGVPAMTDEAPEQGKDAASADPTAKKTPVEGNEAWGTPSVTSWDAPAAATPPPPLSRKTNASDAAASSVRRTGRHARVKAIEDFQPREEAPPPQVRPSGVRARATGSRAAIVARADFDEPLPPRGTGSRRSVGGEGPARPSGVREAPGRSTGSRRSVGASPRVTGSRSAVGSHEGASRRSGVRKSVIPHPEPEESYDSLDAYEQQLADQKRQAELEAEHRRYLAEQQKRLRDKVLRLVMAAAVLMAIISGLAIYFHQKLQPEFIPPPPVPIGVSAEDAKFSAFNVASEKVETPEPPKPVTTGALLTVRSNQPASIYLDGKKLKRRAPATRVPIPLSVQQIDIVSLTTKERRSFAADLQRGKTFELDVTFEGPRR